MNQEFDAWKDGKENGTPLNAADLNDTRNLSKKMQIAFNDFASKLSNLINRNLGTEISYESNILTGENTFSGFEKDGDIATMEVIKKINESLHPIGEVFMTTKTKEEFNPNTVFGGVWKIKSGYFLIGAGEEYSLNSTGGSAEMPRHTHSINDPGHVHELNRPWSGGAGNENAYTLSTKRTQKKVNTASVKTGISINATGDSTNNYTAGGKNNLPPYLAVNMWVKESN